MWLGLFLAIIFEEVNLNLTFSDFQKCSRALGAQRCADCCGYFAAVKYFAVHGAQVLPGT